MIEHKHAHFLRALADGALAEEFELRRTNWHRASWAQADSLDMDYTVKALFKEPDLYEFRRKQKMHVVNGFTVPAPETEMPTEGTKYWIPDTNHPDWNWEFGWRSTTDANLWLGRGLVHLNEAAAVANAKAMCGIDPNAKEES